MDVCIAASFVRVIAENSHRYSVDTQRTLLEGIFQLASLCDDQLNERPDAPAYDGVKASLLLARLFASTGLKHGGLDDAFRLASECFIPAAAVPSEFDCAPRALEIT